MWSLESSAALRRLIRPAAVAAAAALLAGCFQPLYGDHSGIGGPEPAGVRTALASVDVLQIDAPRGSPDARVAVELRNALLFDLTGGEGSIAPTHRLLIRMTTSKSALIVDVTTGRTEAEVTSIDVAYTLTELATGKAVVNGTGFARVSSDIPGQQQRFAHLRAQRDAENRAAQVVADQIRSRLASYFVAGA